MKSIKELSEIRARIEHLITTDPENAFDEFKKSWSDLEFDDKRYLSPVLLNFTSNRVNNEPDYSNEYTHVGKDYPLQQICCTAINQYINDEFSGRLNIQKLQIGPGITPKDIAAVFKLLFDLKYIDNSLSEIEEVIVPLFQLKDNTTIDRYLNNNSQLVAAAKRFQKAINRADLVNRPV
jgi:hypothetical protein